MKKNAILLFLIYLGLSACSKAKTPEVPTTLIKPKVAVEAVKTGPLEGKMGFTGFLKAWRKADLTPGMPGRVDKIMVKEGDRVAEGQVLAEMDNTQLSAMENNYQVAKVNYERMKELLQNNAISQSQFEPVESGYKTAEITLKSMRSNTQIAAPFAGMVTAVAREAGELFAPGMSMPGAPSGLIQIMDVSQLLMEVQVNEMNVSKINKGQRVQVFLPSLPEQVFTGTVEWINPAGDYSSHTFSVSVKVPNPGGVLKPGFFGRVEIITQNRTEVISVPRSAVVNERYAYVVKNDSLAERREISVGISNQERVEISSGLNPGDLVIIQGNKVLGQNTLVELEKHP